MRKRTIKIPIYTGELVIVLDKDLSYVQNKYKTKDLRGYGAVTIKDENKNRSYVVAFEGVDCGLIAHEVVQLVNYIFLDCGQELDRVNDEAQAYLTGWLFEEIYNFIK